MAAPPHSDGNQAVTAFDTSAGKPPLTILADKSIETPVYLVNAPRLITVTLAHDDVADCFSLVS
jgi:hypothetical protein